jgi:hypothetical protein
MTEHVFGYTNQVNKTNTYTSGTCACWHCSSFTPRKACHEVEGVKDWSIADVRCCGAFCTAQNKCARIDPSTCSIGLDKDSKNPISKVTWNRRAPSLKCQFDLDKINTRSQVLAFNEKFGDNKLVMSKFCSQKSNTCPRGLEECSRLLSVGDDGNMCREWFNTQSASTRDTFMQNYCFTHDTEDCKCFDRTHDKLYNSLKPAEPVNDGCWYTPCANEQEYLVPSNLVNPTCPSDICEVIYNIAQDRDVNIDDASNVVSCAFPDQPPTPPVNEKTPYIVFGGGLLVFLVLVLMR